MIQILSILAISIVMALVAFLLWNKHWKDVQKLVVGDKIKLGDLKGKIIAVDDEKSLFKLEIEVPKIRVSKE